METKFSPGQRIIWNSGFGYEIGYFVKEINDSSMFDGLLRVKFESGLCFDKEGIVLKSELNPYTETLVSELAKKYGYEKTFSETF